MPRQDDSNAQDEDRKCGYCSLSTYPLSPRDPCRPLSMLAIAAGTLLGRDRSIVLRDAHRTVSLSITTCSELALDLSPQSFSVVAQDILCHAICDKDRQRQRELSMQIATTPTTVNAKHLDSCRDRKSPRPSSVHHIQSSLVMLRLMSQFGCYAKAAYSKILQT